MEDMDPLPLSALDVHIVRSAFRSSVAEGLVGESGWSRYVTALVKELTGRLHVDAEIVEWIIRKEPAKGQTPTGGCCG